jgi:hypothetical protein
MINVIQKKNKTKQNKRILKWLKFLQKDNEGFFKQDFFFFLYIKKNSNMYNKERNVIINNFVII